jgi:hypothetical protein
VSDLPRLPHRQLCSVCKREYAVDFFVPNDVWELATHHSQRDDLICLDCFARMADCRFVQWDRDIEFVPRSLVSQMQIAGFVPREQAVWEHETTKAISEARESSGHRARFDASGFTGESCQEDT